MNIKYVGILIMLCLSAISCQTVTNDTKPEKLLFSGENHFSLKETILIPLETTTNCLISYIDQIEIKDDRIFVLDSYGSKCLFVFDLNGKYITQIGTQGEGPQEFVIPASFNLYTDIQQLSILDLAQQKVLFYDLEGYHFIESKHIPFSATDFNRLPGDHYVVYNNTPVSKTNESHFTITDTNLQIENDYIRIQFNNGHLNPPFKNTYIQAGKTKGFVRFRKEIYAIEANGVYPIYELAFEKHTFPPADFLIQSAKTNFNTNYLPDLEQSDYISSLNVIENDSSLLVYYIVNKNPYIGIYNKNNHTTHLCSLQQFQERTAICGIETVCGRSTYSFIGIIDPYKLKEQIETKATCMDELRKIAVDCSKEDNPILFIFN